MNSLRSKIFVILAVAFTASIAVYYATRRAPACAGDGKKMSTQAECQAWGIDVAVCKDAIAKARETTARAAPKSETQLQCETRFTDCFAIAGGGFAPVPSFCLRKTDKGDEVTEIRYLTYEADRMNRRKTIEVRID